MGGFATAGSAAGVVTAGVVAATGDAAAADGSAGRGLKRAAEDVPDDSARADTPQSVEDLVDQPMPEAGPPRTMGPTTQSKHPPPPLPKAQAAGGQHYLGETPNPR